MIFSIFMTQGFKKISHHPLILVREGSMISENIMPNLTIIHLKFYWFHGLEASFVFRPPVAISALDSLITKQASQPAARHRILTHYLGHRSNHLPIILYVCNQTFYCEKCMIMHDYAIPFLSDWNSIKKEAIFV